MNIYNGTKGCPALSLIAPALSPTRAGCPPNPSSPHPHCSGNSSLPVPWSPSAPSPLLAWASLLRPQLPFPLLPPQLLEGPKRFSPFAAPICSPSMESSSPAYNRNFLSFSARRSSQRAWRRFPPFARRSCSPSIMESSFPPSAAPSCSPSMDSSSSAYNRSFLSLSPRRPFPAAVPRQQGAPHQALVRQLDDEGHRGLLLPGGHVRLVARDRSRPDLSWRSWRRPLIPPL